VIAENGISQEEVDDLDTGQFGRSTERGYYGQALRERLVHKPLPLAPRTVNILLWVINVVTGLLLTAFVAWRLYTLYFVGGT
jgi:hypothetical protein